MPRPLREIAAVAVVVLAAAVGCSRKISSPDKPAAEANLPSADVGRSAAAASSGAAAEVGLPPALGSEEFEIVFRGLCAHLIDTGKERAAVLLVKNTAHPHRPRLMVDLGDLTNPADMKYFREPVEHVGWMDLPSKCDIQVRPGGNLPNENLSIEAADSKEKDCPKGANRNNLGWLVDLNALTGNPSRGDLRTPDVFPSGVTARCFLRAGKLTVAGHSKGKIEKRFLKFGFSNLQQWGSRSIADSVSYKVKSEPTVTVDLKAPDFNATISFDTPARVYVLNNPDPNDKAEPAEHFDAFYNLLNSDKPRPKLEYTGECDNDDLRRFDKGPPRKPCPQAILWESTAK